MLEHRRTSIAFVSAVLAVTLAAGCSKSERSPRPSPAVSAGAKDVPTANGSAAPGVELGGTSTALSIDLPRTAAIAVDDDQPAVVVSLAADGRLFFGSSAVTSDELPARFGSAVKQNPDVRIVLHADRSVPHGTVVTVMAMAKTAGVHRLALATAPPPTP